MRIQELIGQNVKVAREAAGLSQRELGQRVQAVLGGTWWPQAVSAAEKGARDWTAQDLLAVASALGRPIASFLVAPVGADEDDLLEVPGERTVRLSEVMEPAPRRTVQDLAVELERLTKELREAVWDQGGFGS